MKYLRTKKSVFEQLERKVYCNLKGLGSKEVTGWSRNKSRDENCDGTEVTV